MLCWANHKRCLISASDELMTATLWCQSEIHTLISLALKPKVPHHLSLNFLNYRFFASIFLDTIKNVKCKHTQLPSLFPSKLHLPILPPPLFLTLWTLRKSYLSFFLAKMNPSTWLLTILLLTCSITLHHHSYPLSPGPWKWSFPLTQALSLRGGVDPYLGWWWVPVLKLWNYLLS